MSDASAVLSLPYILPAQAQKHVTHNEALARLDVAVQLAVIARDVTAPPPAAQSGDRYLVPSGAVNEWAGHAGEIALRDAGAWRFEAPVAGWRALVLSEDQEIRFDGTDWQAGVATWGVNTGADAANRLAVSSPATLLTHDGAGHQVKVNKAGSGDTASLLFQTGWSGRAEMGTAGTDDFAIKTSADGSAWVTALSLDAATGRASGAAVQATPTDTGTGKLARADYTYGPGNLLGAVAQAAGIPTGAALERGSNANGQYLRLADGTQICWHMMASGASGATLWSFPAAFLAGSAPIVLASVQNQTPHFASTGTPSASAVNFSVWALSSSRAAHPTALLALGRWF